MPAAPLDAMTFGALASRTRSIRYGAARRCIHDLVTVNTVDGPILVSVPERRIRDSAMAAPRQAKSSHRSRSPAVARTEPAHRAQGLPSVQPPPPQHPGAGRRRERTLRTSSPHAVRLAGRAVHEHRARAHRAAWRRRNSPASTGANRTSRGSGGARTMTRSELRNIREAPGTGRSPGESTTPGGRCRFGTHPEYVAAGDGRHPAQQGPARPRRGRRQQAQPHPP